MTYNNKHKDSLLVSISSLIKKDEERILTAITNFTSEMRKNSIASNKFLDTLIKMYSLSITPIMFLSLYHSHLTEKKLLSRSVLLSQIVSDDSPELFRNSLIGLSNKVPNINLRYLIEINVLDLIVKNLIETENFFVDYLYQDSDKSLYDDFVGKFVDQVIIDQSLTAVKWLDQFIDFKIEFDTFSERIRLEPYGLAEAVFNKHLHECLRVAFRLLEKNSFLPTLNYRPMIKITINKTTHGELSIGVINSGIENLKESTTNSEYDVLKYDLNILNTEQDKIIQSYNGTYLSTVLFYDRDLFLHDFNMSNPKLDKETISE